MTQRKMNSDLSIPQLDYLADLVGQEIHLCEKETPKAEGEETPTFLEPLHDKLVGLLEGKKTRKVSCCRVGGIRQRYSNSRGSRCRW
jgi:hypothetical protein